MPAKVDAADQDSCERMSSGYSYSGPVDRVDAYCANSQVRALILFSFYCSPSPSRSSPLRQEERTQCC